MTTPQTRGSWGGLTRAALYTSAEMGEMSRRGWNTRMARLVPDAVTDPCERDRMARAAVRIHFSKMAVRRNELAAERRATRAAAIAAITNQEATTTGDNHD